MRPDDHAPPTDLDDDLDLDLAADTPAPTTPDADASAPPAEAETEADPVAFIDEDLLEPDLGDLDAPLLVHDELDDLDEQLLDSDDEGDADDEDDLEMALLHELGIDLDAPDADEDTVDIGVALGDDSGDEEVAA